MYTIGRKTAIDLAEVVIGLPLTIHTPPSNKAYPNMDLKKAKAISELWKRGVLTFKLHSAQKLIYSMIRSLPKTVRERLLLISRRFGKSYLGVVMALEDCLQGDDRQVFIIGPNIKQTRKILMPIMKKITKDAPAGLIKETKSELMWKVGNSTLHIGAFDTALESFRGMEAYSIYLEETGQANVQDYEYIVDSVLRPALMHSRGPLTHLTTPGKAVDHPLHTITMPKTILSNSFYKYTIEDNPLLTPEEIASEIQDMGGRDSPGCMRELFCEIVRDEQRVIIPEFNVEDHVKPLVAPAYTFYLSSIDFGGVQDNHAELLCYYDFERNKRCVIDERWLEINTPTTAIIDACLDMEQKNQVKWLNEHPTRIVDAPDQLLIDIKRSGFKCVKPTKGKDSVEDGLQALRVAFQKNQIEIDPRCKHLIATLNFAMWDDRRKDFMRTTALGHCDMLAALSYAFRHLNVHSNPIPPHLGKHPHTHYIRNERDEQNEQSLNSLFGD